jgi:toluene monooxygenase system protein E
MSRDHRQLRAEPPLDGRAPSSAYELVSSRLLYYVGRGFEVDVPLGRWYERYQRASPLNCPDWEVFADPDRTTYSSYTRSRKEAELALDRASSEAASVPPPAREWLGALARTLPPLRYAFHGFHMVASYVGQMAPSSRIALCALFQSGDELRRIEHIAYRMCELQERHAEFGAHSKAEWQSAPAWQPLREVVERLLVSYDFGEAFVALNLCVKPIVDEAAVRCLADECLRRGDAYWAAPLQAAFAACDFQRRWSAALARVAVEQQPANREVIGRWLELWSPRALAAVDALAPLFGDAAAIGRRVREFHRAFAAGALTSSAESER